MDGSVNITAYDLVVLGLFALLIGRGIWLGFLKQVTGLLALYLGYLAASQYHDRLFPFLRDLSENPKVVFLASYAILFCGTYVVAMLLGKLLSYSVQVTIAGWFDRFLGAVLGFLKALILVVLLHMILGTILAPENQMLRSCRTCDTLNSAVSLCRDLIKDKEVREALMQHEPAISIDTVKEYFAPPANQQAPEKPDSE